MWAAHDNSWDKTFVEKNLMQLKANSKATASVSKVIFHNKGVPVRHSDATFSAREALSPENYAAFSQSPEMLPVCTGCTEPKD